MEYSSVLTKQKAKCKLILDALMKEYEYVSILGQHNIMKMVRVDSSNNHVDTRVVCGYTFKMYKDHHYCEYSTDDISLPVEDLVKRIKEMTVLHPMVEDSIMKIDLVNEEEMCQKFNRPNEGKEYTILEIVDECKKLQELMMKEDPRMINANVSNITRYNSSMFLSPKKDLEQFYTWTNLGLVAIVKEGNKIKSNRGGINYNNIERCFKEANEEYPKVVKVALELLKAESIEPGYYDVVVDPGVAGLIAHEAFGHGVELDMFVKNRAKAKGYVEDYVASPIVSMRDGAKSALSAGSYFFDDDGVIGSDTLIIDHGILKHGISDALSAAQLGEDPTGNGRRESYLRKSYSRMTNTFFMPGNDDPEEMIKSIDYGYMICDSSNGMEDPKNWNIQCVASYGREIKDGKFTGKIVAPVVISGYVPDLLKSISMISKEYKIFGSGMCGKGYKEWVFVSDGGPYMKAKVKLG